MFAFCDENNKTIHFIGIGGIGMSGIAEILHSLGYVVQGSDKSTSQNTQRLEKLGISVFIGHEELNIKNADIIVYSSAISKENPELLYAKAHKIPCLSRAEMLSQIVRFKKSVVVAGSHGKTTVTSICAAILETAGLDPTVVNGGVIHSYQTNAKLGNGDWSVIESDESDGSFINFFPTVGIITNIDKEHIGHYQSFDNLKHAFSIFIHNIPFYGAGIVCIDDQNIASLVSNITDRKIITYSIENESMFKGINIRRFEDCSIFDVIVNGSEILKDFKIPILGEHNIKNAIATIAMAHWMGIDMDVVRSTLADFSGVGRRWSLIGNLDGIRMIDDYAHHPTEIIAVIDAAKQACNKKITVICQPHRFTRLNSLFDEFIGCFKGADNIIILPVYRADDSESAPLTETHLFNELLKKHENTRFADGYEGLLALLKTMIKHGEISSGDIILFTGAGSISKWGRDIFAMLNGNKS